MAEDDDWLCCVLWTDEAHFTLGGSVNSHSCRVWATENPRTVVETPLHDEKATVWVGFNTSTVIGSFFFEEKEGKIFMQEGAEPHIARSVKNILRTSFGDDCKHSRHFQLA